MTDHPHELSPLLETMRPELLAYARLSAGHLLRSKESCSDMVQDVFCRLVEEGRSFKYRGEAALRRWLFETLRHRIVDRRRYYLAARRNASLESATSPSQMGAQGLRALGKCYASIASPAGSLQSKEDLERIERAFDGLEEHHQEVILLVRIEQLSYSEVGKRMERSEDAVRMLLMRALAALSRRLAREGITPPE